MSEPIQEITLSVFSDGGCSIKHKHTNFTEDGFIARSHEGAVSAVYNLLRGFLPWPADLGRKPGQPEPIYKGWPKPKPLD